MTPYYDEDGITGAKDHLRGLCATHPERLGVYHGTGETCVEVPTPYYDEDGITIYHGDCREVLPKLQALSVDMLLVDPPYGMDLKFGWLPVDQREVVRGDGARTGVRTVRHGVNLFHQSLIGAVPLMKDDAHFYSFCNWESWPDFYNLVSTFWPVLGALVWWKNRGGMGDLQMQYAPDYEVILYGALGKRPLRGKRHGAVLEGFQPDSGKDRPHPTSKPQVLMEFLINASCPEGGLVLDPFMGSGSTLAAAKQLGRRAIGIEIEEKYCEIAVQRLAQGVLELS